MAKVIQAKTLSEAFLAVREYLWNGCGNFAAVYPKQEQMICFAACKAKNAGKISKEHYAKITDVIESRLFPYTGIRQYIASNYSASTRNDILIQDYRHAWLIHLSKEFRNKYEPY